MRIQELGISLLLLAATASVVRSQTVVTGPIIVTRVAAPQPSDASGTSNPPFTPGQIQQAYGLNLIQSGGSASGAGQTIAIIDAYNYPNAASALNTFSSEFGLPQVNGAGGPTFTVLNQSGGTSLPGTDPAGAGNDNWEFEEALDIEWAHAMAPKANIILYECTDNSNANLFSAVTTAKNNAAVSVVSMSFDAGEFSGETSNDSTFTTPASKLAIKQGVTFVASTGDGGAPGGYPAFSPNVVAVGGTSLYLTSSLSYSGESAWSDGGGGVSHYEPKPSYQQTPSHGSVLANASSRATPDVSFDADPNTGVYTYDPYNGGWFQIGGTSLSAPCWAGLIADADGIRSAAGNGTLDGPSQTLPALYNLPNTDFHDVTTGNNGYPAGPGYDLATGLGTPVANTLVPDLAAYGVGGVNGNWIATGGGSWSTTSNWDSNGVPGASNQDTATFGTVIGSNSATVTLDGSRTLCSLTFSTAGGGSYTLSRSSSDSTSTLTLAGTGATAVLANNGGNQAIDVPVILGASLNVSAASGATLTINGPVSETGGSQSLSLSGGGTLVLAGSNTYSGGTTIGSGLLQAGNNSALGASAAALAVNTGGTLDVHGYTVNVGQLGGSGIIDNLSGSGSLTVGNGNVSSTFSGTVQNSFGQLSLIKTGSGTLTLTGSNTYAGSTSVAAGTLAINAPTAFPVGSSLSVVAGATFNVNAGPQTIGAITGGGSFNVTGTAAITAASIVQGSTSVASGATLNLTGPGAAAPGLTIANSGSLNVTGGNSQTVAVVGSSAAGNVGSLDVTGAGTQFSAGSVFQNSIEIDSGAKLSLSAGAGKANWSSANALTISGNTAAWTGDLDVGASGITLSNATSAEVAIVESLIKAGYASGTWAGTTGITSSAANAYPLQTSIGFTFNASTGKLVIAAAIPGDTDLSGVVNNADRDTFVADFGKTVPAGVSNWQFGCFNYGTTVNNADRNIFVSNFGNASFPSVQIGGGPVSNPDMVAGGGVAASTVAPVPEPGTLALLAAGLVVAGIAAVRRRTSSAA
ncbi:MAG: autotransporter-associated beta strand repeat-containing protein [Thermoguttaceae bacterium]